MVAAVSPLSIFVEGTKSQPFKSLNDLKWLDLPPLCILTGLNGSGKTQLLDLIANGLVKTQIFSGPTIGTIVRTEGQQFEDGDIAYLPSNQTYSAGGAADISGLQNAKRQLHQTLLHPHNINTLQLRSKKARIEKLLGKSIQQFQQDEFADSLPDDFFFNLDDVNVLSGIPQIFVAYRLKAVRKLEEGVSRSAIEGEIGPSPWKMINEALTTAAFPYRINSPEGTDFLSPFATTMTDTASGRIIRPDDLSSGEKVILETILWLYTSEKQTALPKLFLMDEPDAHLHPSMARQFIDVVKDVLVKKYGIRVIIATHSPSTVALSPDDAIFEMRRFDNEVRRSTSKAGTLALLTAGLVLVSPNSKFVLVEDELDIEFYSAIRDILTDYGVRKDAMALPATPSIVFLPASTGKNAKKIGGGCTVVSGWIEKFDAEPLLSMFRGLIDRDTSNVDAGRVLVTKRYSVENYLLDPINVFACLFEQGLAPSITGITISVGSEHLLQNEDNAVLQQIVDVICQGVVKAAVTAAAKERAANPASDAALAATALSTSLQSMSSLQTVQFTNGLSLSYPQWLINHRGHDLLPAFQEAWHGMRINPKSLLLAIRKVRLMPKDLADLLQRVMQ